MVKKQAGEAYKEDYDIPEVKVELKHFTEDCTGKFVVEFKDHKGDHHHCPACGAWVEVLN